MSNQNIKGFMLCGYDELDEPFNTKNKYWGETIVNVDMKDRIYRNPIEFIKIVSELG